VADGQEPPAVSVPRKHRGAASEMTAAIWLLECGYEVHRNVSQHGVADLIIVDRQTGLMQMVEVRY